MEQQVPKSEKAYNLLLGVFFVIAGIICLLFTFSYLPLLGLFMGASCVVIGVYFLAKHRRRLSDTSGER